MKKPEVQPKQSDTLLKMDGEPLRSLQISLSRCFVATQVMHLGLEKECSEHPGAKEKKRHSLHLNGHCLRQDQGDGNLCPGNKDTEDPPVFPHSVRVREAALLNPAEPKPFDCFKTIKSGFLDLNV